jgi:hypothetical protein
MRAWGKAAAAAAGLAAGTAAAETTSVTLFQHKNWEVELVTFDDGSRACLAEVDARTDSFTVWLYDDATFKLQFYSTEWDFGDPGTTADLQLQIDRRSPWNLTAADLYKSSVLFTLPDNDTGVRFLVEVAQGNRLNLNTAAGEGVKWYSLAGSNASMRAMLECGDKITGSTTNPFN